MHVGLCYIWPPATVYIPRYNPVVSTWMYTDTQIVPLDYVPLGHARIPVYTHIYTHDTHPTTRLVTFQEMTLKCVL